MARLGKLASSTFRMRRRIAGEGVGGSGSEGGRDAFPGSSPSTRMRARRPARAVVPDAEFPRPRGCPFGTARRWREARVETFSSSEKFRTLTITTEGPAGFERRSTTARRHNDDASARHPPVARPPPASARDVRPQIGSAQTRAAPAARRAPAAPQTHARGHRTRQGAALPRGSRCVPRPTVPTHPPRARSNPTRDPARLASRAHHSPPRETTRVARDASPRPRPRGASHAFF